MILFKIYIINLHYLRKLHNEIFIIYVYVKINVYYVSWAAVWR